MTAKEILSKAFPEWVDCLTLTQFDRFAEVMDIYAKEKASLGFDAGHDSGQYDAGEFLGERPLDKKEFIKLHFPNI